MQEKNQAFKCRKKPKLYRRKDQIDRIKLLSRTTDHLRKLKLLKWCYSICYWVTIRASFRTGRACLGTGNKKEAIRFTTKFLRLSWLFELSTAAEEKEFVPIHFRQTLFLFCCLPSPVEKRSSIEQSSRSTGVPRCPKQRSRENFSQFSLFSIDFHPSSVFSQSIVVVVQVHRFSPPSAARENRWRKMPTVQREWKSSQKGAER